MECLKPKRRTPKHGDNLAPAESRVRLDSDAEDDVLPSPRHPRLKRQPTSIEQALKQYNPGATLKISQLQAVPFSEMERIGKSVLPSEIQGSLFVGHLATDMDSIGSAIAAAELLEGIATRASEINPETEFVLDYWKIPVPPPFEAVWEEHKHSADAKVCLVDHNQKSQMNAAIPMGRVRGVIDHHALQAGTLVTDIPVYMNIRPWGSACTILGHMFLTANRLPSEKAAAVLLSGILSDTLNLQSPTTTDVDRSMVAVLGQLAGVTDVNGYAKLMFKAKSKDLLTLSATTLLAGDLKRFQFNDTIIAFAVIETTDVGGLLARVPELLDELRAYKAEHNLSFAFCALVDIINISSQLIVSSAGERQLAEHVFGGRTDQSTNLLDLGKRVSRKKDYIPPLSTAIAGGWKYVPEPEQKQEAPPVQYGEVYMDCSEHGCQLKRRPSQLLSSLGNLVVAMSAHSHQHEPRPSKIASPPIPESPRQGGDAEPANPSN